MKRCLPPATLAVFEETKYLYIRTGDHRFIPIWVVVVSGRVIVRSWNDRADGWYRAFLASPCGAIQIDEDEISVRAVRVRSARLNNAADAAYGTKYTTRADAKYVKGFKSPKRKATTLELLPGQRLSWEPGKGARRSIPELNKESRHGRNQR